MPAARRPSSSTHPAWAAVILFAVPPLLSRIRIGNERRLRRVVIYPLIVFLYPLAVLQMNPQYRVDFFEDSHNIPVASEMLRGERPYRDIVPTHGILSDGIVDMIGLKLGRGSLHEVFATRLVAGVSISTCVVRPVLKVAEVPAVDR